MFKTFCEAKTGFPIVDAGVRELLKTGSMHNRVRMVVASFFTKDLLLPWQWGEAFFAKHLLDYDKASNVLSWQWSAGTGVDPQPYFRVFNPYLQSKKFDKDGVYIKYYVEELRNIEAKYLHKEEYLLEQNILNYPKPMVNHKEAAKKAIEIFKAQKV
jgi:deoxyribodipyrimidine photo-lyase